MAVSTMLLLMNYIRCAIWPSIELLADHRPLLPPLPLIANVRGLMLQAIISQSEPVTRFKKVIVLKPRVISQLRATYYTSVHTV